MTHYNPYPRKQKERERKFPIKEWEKAKGKERKFPIKEWEKEKRGKKERKLLIGGRRDIREREREKERKREFFVQLLIKNKYRNLL